MIYRLVVDHKNVGEFKSMRGANAAYVLAEQVLVAAGVDVHQKPICIAMEKER